MGLINRLNLTEFKAVLAHEFGHFSQNSMRLGSYVYTANRVIADIVYGRGALDRFVSMLSRLDLRIAIFAWGFIGVLWTMRKGLELLYRGINFAHVSLSREMEYNADLVAASVTGSDALVFALVRLDLASDALGQEEMGRLRRLAQGQVQLTGKDFEHRGQRFGLDHVSRLVNELENEITHDFAAMHALDRLVFLIHYAMAARLGEADRSNLEER